MKFNLKLRSDLAKFLNAFADENPSVEPQEIDKVCAAADVLFKAYHAEPEKSNLAQVEYYQDILSVLNKYHSIYKSKKSWTDTLCGFCGVYSDDEQQLIETIAIVQSAYNTAASEYDHGDYNFILRFFRFFGITMDHRFRHKIYEEYSLDEMLKYFSHHLMGTSNLNHHELLQGKSRSQAFMHFYNDLTDFVQNKNVLLDDATKKLLDDLLAQIKSASQLANNLDLILYNYYYTGLHDAQENFLADLSYKVLNILFRLPIGKSFNIPLGYVGEKGGHGYLIECTRINDREYIYKIFNTGDGVFETASYKTIIMTGFALFMSSCPVKVTDPLSMDWVIGTGFIEKLLTPIIINDSKSREAMNKTYRDLYYEKKLHDDTQRLKLQTNGTCSHTPIIEWFKTKVPESIFLLFDYFTLQKASERFAQYQPYSNGKELTDAVADLRVAAQKTVTASKGFLSNYYSKLERENADLKKQLSTLLAKKAKSLKNISDFKAYSEKKSKNDKLQLEDKQKISTADAMTGWLKPSSVSLNPLNLLRYSSQVPKRDDRVQKAIIAKKIAAHEEYLGAVEKVSDIRKKCK